MPRMYGGRSQQVWSATCSVKEGQRVEQHGSVVTRAEKPCRASELGRTTLQIALLRHCTGIDKHMFCVDRAVVLSVSHSDEPW